MGGKEWEIFKMAETEEQEDRLLSITQATEKVKQTFDISPASIRRYILYGGLNHKRLPGGKILVYSSEVDKIINGEVELPRGYQTVAN